MNDNKKKSKVVMIIILFLILGVFVSVATLGICIKRNERVNSEQNVQEIKVDEKKVYIIPRIILNGKILELENKKQSSEINVEYVINKERVFKSNAKIKLQGTSSLNYEKKNYTITFYSDNDFSELRDIDLDLGWGAQSKYCLKANWIDSTQARNIVSARLMSQVQSQYGLFEDCPNNGLIDGYPVEIYINGKYQGLYTCNIPKSDWMFNMDKENPNHIVMCAETNNNTSTSFNSEAPIVDGHEWSIEVGPNNTPEEVEQTFEKLNRVIRFVKDSTDEEFRNNIGEYLNLDSCLNYLSFLYLGNCIDNVTKNMLLVTYDGKVWYPSMYDLDSTWGLKFDGTSIYSVENEYMNSDKGPVSVLWSKIIRCFPDEFKKRYNELRNTVLSNENITKEFEEFNNCITKEAWNKEHKKWKDIPSISYGIEQIIDHVPKRAEYVDKVINEM